MVQPERSKIPVLVRTADGSPTLFAPEVGEHYHSLHGAVQESEHIFIRSGFRMWEASASHILEVGLGTGLNAFLTLRDCECQGLCTYYYAIERYPLDPSLALSLHYATQVWAEGAPLFEALHTAPWGQPVEITPRFTLHKVMADATACAFPPCDVIYFDAFSPERQPELWEPGIFRRLAEVASQGAILVTYCAKGEVRRRIQAAGFDVRRLPGPPGKRHILLAKYDNQNFIL
ncbi:MAG: tRNA (5-methylaminomethyl-2-thiouridine)(34)-methyltransferase MnmD [Tannerellaceae bacterium]|nr:tRNA (5-methylaminomethyl-2-thiouridine)(34)-methyltransferase MnmD [Tannerellaceae bacterium]